MCADGSFKRFDRGRANNPKFNREISAEVSVLMRWMTDEVARHAFRLRGMVVESEDEHHSPCASFSRQHQRVAAPFSLTHLVSVT